MSKPSRHSKRFRGVSAQIKARAKKERGVRGRGEKETRPLHPLSFFGDALIFARPKHRNLHRNPTETLARQARTNLDSNSPGGDSYMEQMGMLIGNFEFNP